MESAGPDPESTATTPWRPPARATRTQARPSPAGGRCGSRGSPAAHRPPGRGAGPRRSTSSRSSSVLASSSSSSASSSTRGRRCDADDTPPVVRARLPGRTPARVSRARRPARRGGAAPAGDTSRGMPRVRAGRRRHAVGNPGAQARARSDFGASCGPRSSPAQARPVPDDIWPAQQSPSRRSFSQRAPCQVGTTRRLRLRHAAPWSPRSSCRSGSARRWTTSPPGRSVAALVVIH